MQTEMTLESLQEELHRLGNSPKDKGTVELIIRRPNMGEREVLQEAELDLEQGLIGDNWLTRGSSRTEDGKANFGAQIAIMNSRVIQAITQDKLRWALAGDQLYLDLDISSNNLNAGDRLAIGSAILEVSEVPHTGCGKFSERFGSAATRLVNSKEGREEQRYRGINTRVVQAGTIRQGDIVTKIPASN
jgi:hypothetical protein